MQGRRMLRFPGSRSSFVRAAVCLSGYLLPRQAPADAVAAASAKRCRPERAVTNDLFVVCLSPNAQILWMTLMRQGAPPST